MRSWNALPAMCSGMSKGAQLPAKYACRASAMRHSSGVLGSLSVGESTAIEGVVLEGANRSSDTAPAIVRSQRSPSGLGMRQYLAI